MELKKAYSDFPKNVKNPERWPWGEPESYISYHDDSSLKLKSENGYPRLTVIMPSFNQGNFIEESIRSVLLQGYPNLEFMIFDGGSSDNTIKIIEKYAQWITYWESRSDRGQSHAINKGLKKSTGEYIAWLNSDDLYYPGALFHIAEATRKYPDAGMIYGPGAKIDVHSKVIKKIPYRPYNKKLLQTLFYILQQSSFVKRSALDQKWMVDETLHYTMDWELAIRISRKFSIYSIQADIGMFRLHNKCKTQTGNWTRRKEIAKVGRQCNGVLDKNYMIFLMFYPIFKYEVCAPGINGRYRNIFCFIWRKIVSKFVDPDTYMMQ